MPKVLIVMPAYNAEHTIADTLQGLPPVYDQILLCDDASQDNTTIMSQNLGIPTLTHSKNLGYGGNQKTLYDAALKENPDIIIMVHPDNQYSTDCLPQMIESIQEHGANLVLGTRMQTALKHHMPYWKYISNRVLSTIQNKIYKTRLSEFHSGLRAYNADMLRKMPYHSFSNNFVFDSELIAWTVANHFTVQEVPAHCYYKEGVSSISLRASIRYGLSTLKTLLQFKFNRFSSAEEYLIVEAEEELQPTL